MQTVVNNFYNIINGDVVSSAVLQGVNGSTVSVSNTIDLGEFERELLRMFRGLDVRQKIAALSYLYDLENGQALPVGMEASA